MKKESIGLMLLLALSLLAFFMTGYCAYYQGCEDERKSQWIQSLREQDSPKCNEESAAIKEREKTDDYNKIYKPAYIRVRVLKTGTVSWCMSAHGEVYQTGDKVKVNLFTHMIVDNDPLANSCILLDSYSPDDSNNN